jgi:hypothetical protein
MAESTTIPASPQPAPGDRLFDQFMRSLTEISTEQEYLHHLEALTAHPEREVRMGAYRVLIALELSVLGDTAAPREVADWETEFDSCSIGLPIPTARSSHLPGGVSYDISINGAPDIPGGVAMPADVNRVCDEMRRNQAARCERNLSKLHLRLRRKLREVKWLKDEFGHEDSDRRKVRKDQARQM